MARQYIGITLFVDNTQKLTVQNFVKERGEARPFMMNVSTIFVYPFYAIALPLKSHHRLCLRCPLFVSFLERLVVRS
jgi:hypothetical protein